MLNWLNFFSILFILNISFFFFLSFNFFILNIVAEMNWIYLFCINSIISILIDDGFLISFSFYILGFAAIELSVSLMFLIFLKTNNLEQNFFENIKQKNLEILKNFLKKSKLKNKNL